MYALTSMPPPVREVAIGLYVLPFLIIGLILVLVVRGGQREMINIWRRYLTVILAYLFLLGVTFFAFIIIIYIEGSLKRLTGWSLNPFVDFALAFTIGVVLTLFFFMPRKKTRKGKRRRGRRRRPR